MLLKGRTVLSDIAVLSHTYLIPFKAKAWLDLREKKAQGFLREMAQEPVDLKALKVSGVTQQQIIDTLSTVYLAAEQ